MKKFTRMNQKDFKSIKTLQEAGIKRYKASLITKRSATTIDRVYKTDTFEEYQELTARKNDGYKKETLVAVDTISDVLAKAIQDGGLLVTRRDKYSLEHVDRLIADANKSGVTVAFAPEDK